MRTITKRELVHRIAETVGVSKADARKVVQAFLDMIVDELGRGNRLEFRKFGVFEVRQRKPRVGQNPKTLQKVEIPGRRVVKFKEGRDLKERLAQEGGED